MSKTQETYSTFIASPPKLHIKETPKQTSAGRLKANKQDSNNEEAPTLPHSSSLLQFVHLLTQEFKKKNGGRVDVEELRTIIEGLGGHKISMKDLTPFIYVEEDARYTRNLVWENEYFSLLLLCWNPKNESCIHAHSSSQCWARCVSGELTEVFYDADPDQDMVDMTPTKSTLLQAGKACYIDDGLGVHKIVNHTNDLSISLHLYAPPYKKCAFFHSITGQRLIGDITYHTEYGKVCQNKPVCCKARARSDSDATSNSRMSS